MNKEKFTLSIHIVRNDGYYTKTIILDNFYKLKKAKE